MEETKINTDEQMKQVTTFAGGVSKALEDAPDYSDEGWKVGQAGLYWDETEGSEEGAAKLVEKDGTETLITTTIVLNSGEKKKGNNLSCSVEQGIADYVTELADEPTNHLPNSKTGVIVWYLSEGIARDFGTTWDKAPTSLGGGSGRGSKSDRAKGKRVMTKGEKNDIIDRLDMNYYQDDIKSGRITLEDAFGEIKKAYEKKAQVESLGYYLSPNKTEGVLMYDWKNIVGNTYDRIPEVTGWALYTANKFEVLLPNIFDNYFKNNHENANKKGCMELVKSALMGCVVEDAVGYKLNGFKQSMTTLSDGTRTRMPSGKNKTTDGSVVQFGGFADGDTINSEEDILNLLGHKVKGQLMGIHLLKNKQPGMMKPRYIVVDEYKDGKQTLYLYNSDTSCSVIKDTHTGKAGRK